MRKIILSNSSRERERETDNTAAVLQNIRIEIESLRHNAVNDPYLCLLFL